MGIKIGWNDAMDATVYDLRTKNVPLDVIGQVLGLSRTTVAQRIRHLWPNSGMINPVRPQSITPHTKPVLGEYPRDHTGAMLAGDPVPWGILTAGTLLEGAAYPLDPVTRQPR